MKVKRIDESFKHVSDHMWIMRVKIKDADFTPFETYGRINPLPDSERGKFNIKDVKGVKKGLKILRKERDRTLSNLGINPSRENVSDLYSYTTYYKVKGFDVNIVGELKLSDLALQTLITNKNLIDLNKKIDAVDEKIVKVNNQVSNVVNQKSEKNEDELREEILKSITHDDLPEKKIDFDIRSDFLDLDEFFDAHQQRAVLLACAVDADDFYAALEDRINGFEISTTKEHRSRITYHLGGKQWIDRGDISVEETFSSVDWMYDFAYNIYRPTVELVYRMWNSDNRSKYEDILDSALNVFPKNARSILESTKNFHTVYTEFLKGSLEGSNEDEIAVPIFIYEYLVNMNLQYRQETLSYKEFNYLYKFISIPTYITYKNTIAAGFDKDTPVFGRTNFYVLNTFTRFLCEVFDNVVEFEDSEENDVNDEDITAEVETKEEPVEETLDEDKEDELPTSEEPAEMPEIDTNKCREIRTSWQAFVKIDQSACKKLYEFGNAYLGIGRELIRDNWGYIRATGKTEYLTPAGRSLYNKDMYNNQLDITLGMSSYIRNKMRSGVAPSATKHVTVTNVTMDAITDCINEMMVAYDIFLLRRGCDNKNANENHIENLYNICQKFDLGNKCAAAYDAIVDMIYNTEKSGK